MILVFTIGFPGTSSLAVDPEFNQGSISSLSGPMDEPTYMEVSIPMQAGNYGGPVVGEHGEVVGVVVATEAIEAFYHVSAPLPRNVAWVLKAEYAQLLFDRTAEPTCSNQFQAGNRPNGSSDLSGSCNAIASRAVNREPPGQV